MLVATTVSGAIRTITVDGNRYIITTTANGHSIHTAYGETLPMPSRADAIAYIIASETGCDIEHTIDGIVITANDGRVFTINYDVSAAAQDNDAWRYTLGGNGLAHATAEGAYLMILKHLGGGFWWDGDVIPGDVGSES